MAEAHGESAQDRAPVHRIVAFTGGDESVGITACGSRIEDPNRPTQVGRFTADDAKVTCPECAPYSGRSATPDATAGTLDSSTS